MQSIQFKIILSIILFTFFIAGLDRYQISQSVTQQFLNFKKSKNELLINTITPVISFNLSLGLESANLEYLQQIIKQNDDLIFLRLLNKDKTLLYEYDNISDEEKQLELHDFNNYIKEIKDEYTEETLATLELTFSNSEFREMRKKNQKIAINLTIITILLLIVFVFFLRLMFKNLRELRDHVLAYNPKLNNFPLKMSDKQDEVSLIRNAIISMVEKITIYTTTLDNTNTLLEEKVRERTKELEESNRELKLLASVDSLTCLYNRRYFLKTSQQVLEIAKRKNAELSLLMLDIDNFKYVNDTYGHQVGDKAIVSVASVLLDTGRKSDIVCRFGGEEFAVILPETNIDGAYVIAEKIRKRVEEQEIEIDDGDGKTLSVTVSVGIAKLDSNLDLELESIIHRADSAMYRAKKSGKNCTCISD